MNLGADDIETYLAKLLKEKFSMMENSGPLNLDSLQLMELAAEIEDKYQIIIPIEEVGSIKNTADAAKLIMRLRT